LRYVLVTSWPRHWDKIGNKTSFSYSMLRGIIMNPDRIIDKTPAVFIKIDRIGLPEKCWEGIILGKKRTEDDLWFEFRLDREIRCPPQYLGKSDGWYVDETT
jgi:hypothetical protein